MRREETSGWRLVREPDTPASDDEPFADAELLREIAAPRRRLDTAKPLLTVDDLADWLETMRSAVRRLQAHEEIPSAWLGRRRVILRERFLQYLAERARGRARRGAGRGPVRALSDVELPAAEAMPGAAALPVSAAHTDAVLAPVSE